MAVQFFTGAITSVGKQATPRSVEQERDLARQEMNMRLIKAMFGVFIAVALGASLTACVVVPVPYGHGGYYHYHRY